MSVCVFVLYVCVGLRVYLHLSVCLCASVATHTSVQVPVSVGGGVCHGILEKDLYCWAFGWFLVVAVQAGSGNQAGRALAISPPSHEFSWFTSVLPVSPLLSEVWGLSGSLCARRNVSPVGAEARWGTWGPRRVYLFPAQIFLFLPSRVFASPVLDASSARVFLGL